MKLLVDLGGKSVYDATGYNIITSAKIPQLSRKSRQPLYDQLKAILEAKIDSGAWKPDAQLPSERELCEQYQVSRITVRQAIKELEVEGRLERRHGRGTFVARPRVEQRLARLTGFTQDMLARSQQPGATVLQLDCLPAPLTVARILHLRANEPVVVLRRLRLASGEPMAVETAYLPDRLVHDLVTENMENRSLYKLLREKFDIIPSRAEQRMQAMACPAAEARLLGIRRNSPVLHIYRTTFDQKDRPFEYVESLYRGDKYVFHAELNHE